MQNDFEQFLDDSDSKTEKVEVGSVGLAPAKIFKSTAEVLAVKHLMQEAKLHKKMAKRYKESEESIRSVTP